MRIHPALAALAVVVILCPVAHAQTWTLDASLKTLADRELKALIRGVEKAPERALKDLLEEEEEHLDQLTVAERAAYAEQAWARLAGPDAKGPLVKRLAIELKHAGVLSKQLLAKVWAEERTRLSGMPERAVRALVDRVVQDVLIERLRAIRNARVEAARLGGVNVNRTSRTVNGARVGSPTTGLEGFGHWPAMRILSEKASLEAFLYKQTFNTGLGELKVTLAEVNGVAEAEVGRVSYRDQFGNKVEGVGVEFTAKARVTGAEVEFTSKEMVATAKNEMGIRAHLHALASVAADGELRAAGVANERGVGVNVRARGGAEARAVARVPITIDLKVFKVRAIPYAMATAGAGVDAHASFEIEWSGKLRVDMGATLSTGVGGGAGMIIEIELGPVLKRAIDRLIQALSSVARPITDWVMGRRMRGPVNESGRLTIDLAALEREWRKNGAPAGEVLDSSEESAQLAARYAPVFYQQVLRGVFDQLRRVDFDGNWDTTDNWNNTDEQADNTAWVYYDVRETLSHYYLSYVVYHSGRASNALGVISNLRRHENDLGGCVVVVRKGAAPGREVEALFTSNGDAVDVYSGATRWPSRRGRFHGSVQFVDEADHPMFDLDRTHAQVWISGKAHDVHGFNGRDDARPFGGRDGIVYYPSARAERPDGLKDEYCGYGLRPLSELVAQTTNPKVFTTRRLAGVRAGHLQLPARMRGTEGPDDQAIPPWAWGYGTDDGGEEHPAEADRVFTGDVFCDPARTLSVLFEVPGDFSREWLYNPYLVGQRDERARPPSPGSRVGITTRIR